MSFIRPVFVPKDNGMVYGPYYELVREERDEEDPKKVKQVYLKYLGKYPGGVPEGTKLTTVDNRVLTYRSRIGKAEVWGDDDVAEEDLERVRKVLDDLTPGQQQHIRMIELIGKPADPGDDAWGYFFPDTRTVRVYGVNRKTGHFTWHLESTIMHEAGHSTYDQLQSGALKETGRILSPMLLPLRKASRALVRSLDKERRADRDLRQAIAEQKAGRIGENEVKKAKRAVIQASDDREAKEIAFNQAMASADLDPGQNPQAAAYGHWQRAIRDEGPITQYAKSKSDRMAVMTNENFAEASAIFTGYDELPLAPQASPRPPRKMTPEEVRKLYPETLAAWNEIRKLEGY